MNDTTKIVLELDMKHLTDEEVAWLHALKTKMTVRSGEEYLARVREKKTA